MYVQSFHWNLHQDHKVQIPQPNSSFQAMLFAQLNFLVSMMNLDPSFQFPLGLFNHFLLHQYVCLLCQHYFHCYCFHCLSHCLSCLSSRQKMNYCYHHHDFCAISVICSLMMCCLKLSRSQSYSHLPLQPLWCSYLVFSRNFFSQQLLLLSILHFLSKTAIFFNMITLHYWSKFREHMSSVFVLRSGLLSTPSL